jgi:hypothetical protein
MYSDPRAASAKVLDGPVDLVGDELVRVEAIAFDGQEILVPAALPGAPEYRSVLRAEQAADQLRAELPTTFDERGHTPVADVRLALDFRDAAGTAVASAAVGLESFINFQLQRLSRLEAGTLDTHM